MADVKQWQESAQTEDINIRNRVKEMQEQVGTLSALTTITLLLTLLMVVLYILEVICGPRAGAKTASAELPTAVVIQQKDGEDKKEEDRKLKGERERADCRHNSNRHFPSKTITLQLDLKRSEKQKEEELVKEAKRASAAVVAITLGAPPTYAESKKDVVLASSVPENRQRTGPKQPTPKKEQQEASKLSQGSGPTQSNASTSGVSSTQEPSLLKEHTATPVKPDVAQPPQAPTSLPPNVAQPSPAPQLKVEMPAAPQPNVEMPTAPQPKVEMPTAPQPKVEMPTAPQPKVEMPAAPQPKLEMPAAPQPNVDMPAALPPTQAQATISPVPALPVPAKPPAVPSSKFAVKKASSGRRPPSRTVKKSAAKTSHAKSTVPSGASSTTTRTVLSMSTSTASQSTPTDTISKLQTAKATPK